MTTNSAHTPTDGPNFNHPLNKFQQEMWYNSYAMSGTQTKENEKIPHKE